MDGDGGSPILERGIVYGTTVNPTTANTIVTASGTTGSFNSTISGLTPGTTYYVRAYAINAIGTSYGSQLTVLTLPDKAASPTASAVIASGFTLNWTATISATSYRLDIATDDTFTSLLPSYSNLSVSGTSQVVTGLTSGTTYHVRIRAVNGSGIGADSDTLTQATQAATGLLGISGTPTSFDTTYGSASLAQTVTATGSGLDGTAVTVTPPAGFEVSTAADFAVGTVGSSASPLSLGTPTSISDQTLYVRLAATAVPNSYSGDVKISGGGADFKTVAVSGTVSTKALTIDSPVVTPKTYNGDASAVITGTLQGINGGDVVTLVGTGTFASADAGTDIDVTSTSTLGGAQAAFYTLSQPTGLKGTINQATQTITFAALPYRALGEPDFVLTGTASSSLTVTYTSSDPSVASISESTVTINGAGTTTITASQPGNGNYSAATEVTRTLSVYLPALLAWEVNGLTGYGTSPFAATTVNSDVTAGGLTRGSGVTTSGTAGSSAWGGTGFDATSLSTAVTTGDFVTFTVSAKTNKAISLATILPYNIRRPASGPTTGQWQYSLDGSSFTDIGSSITWGTTTTSAGNDQNAISLSGISALQNVVSGTTVTFRLVTWGASSATTGAWYFNNTSANDLAVAGTVTSVPAAPTITAITPGNGQLSVAFTPPSDNGGGEITNYEFSTNGGTSFTAVSPESTTSPILITGLSNGTPYNVQIRAVNFVGKGAATSSTPATPYTTPSAPILGAITPGNGQLSVAFTAGATGGSAITDYEWSLDGTNYSSSGTTNSPILISGLGNGTAYTVRIRAVNAAGNGLAATAGSTATPRTTPDAPTISGITPDNGRLDVAFSAPSFDGGAVITNYEYSLNGGTNWIVRSPANTNSPLLITSLTNGVTYDIQLRAVNTAGSGSASTTVQAAPVAPSLPSITLSKTSLTPKTTVYGSPSSAETFTVIGAALTGEGNLTVQAPTGFEVSTDGTNYAPSVDLGIVGGAVSETTIHVRLAANAGVQGTYNSQNITVSGGGAPAASLPTAATGNSVSPKPIGISVAGLSAQSKTYDGTNTVTVTGTAVYSGLANNENHPVTNSVSWSFPDKNRGIGKVLERSADYTAPNANYSLSAQPSLSADIDAREVTVTGAAVMPKNYDASTAAIITGTLANVLPGETVTFNGTGTFASANAGSNISVTSTSTLGGAGAGNYVLTQPTGLTGTINKADQTISFNPLANVVVGSTTLLTATSTSGLPLSYTSSNQNVATIAGSSVVAVAPGVTTITASQAGSGNYNPAVSTSRALNVAASSRSILVAGWDFTTTTNGGTASVVAPNTPKVFNANFGAGTIFLNGTNGASDWLATELDALSGTSSNALVNWNTAGLSLSLLGGTDLTANGKALVIGFSMTNMADLIVSYASRGSSTGFNTHLWEYSTNGSSWIPFDTKTGRTSTSYSILTLSNVSALSNAATAYVRMTVSGASAASGNNRLDNIQLNATALGLPAITPSGTFGSLSTTYGTASDSNGPVLVSGGSLAADILATPPAGFEVSTNGSAWAASASFAQSNGFASGNLFLRLASNAAAGSYSNLAVSLTAGTASNSLTIGTSTVEAKTLTLSNITAISKTFDGNSNATFTGDLVGIVGSDNVTLVGTGTYASTNAGTNISVTSTATLAGTAAGNYSLIQPTGLTGTINKATPSMSVTPDTTAITAGQALSNSVISGGTVTPSDGTWDWSSPEDTNTLVGTNSYAAVYTPASADQVNWNNLTNNLTVVVNAAAPSGSSFSGWLGTNDASAALLAQYAYGAVSASNTVDRANLPAATLSNNSLVLTYFVRKEATNPNLVVPQVHTNLADAAGWGSVANSNITTVGTNTVNGVEVIQKQASVPVDGTRKFLRLKIAE